MDELEKLFERYLQSNIFRNREILLPDYVPDKLPHRDEQIKRLATILAPALSKSKPNNVFIYGFTGTGKTAVTKYVLKRLGSKGEDRVLFAYVNCRQSNTNYRVLAELSRAVGRRVPFTGLSTSEVMSRFVEGLDKLDKVMIIVLDEIDHLVKKSGDDVLYFLTRINQQLKRSRLSLVGITNDLRFMEFLDARVRSSLGEEELVFPPYNSRELEDILRRRAEKAFNKDVLEPSVIAKVASIAARQNGDCRLALDLLLKAAEIAERRGDVKVTEEHVSLAQKEIERNLVVDITKSLPLHVKLVLASIYMLEKERARNLTTGMIYNRYVELSRVIGIDPVTQRRVSEILNELDMMGIINARVVSLGRYGRTKIISLSVPKNSIKEGLEEDLLLLGLADMVALG
ncbi:MAG TPA: AAA family ATPase [Thermofilum sp.]|nr:AAA family ATPase [Thermofilum sp.]